MTVLSRCGLSDNAVAILRLGALVGLHLSRSVAEIQVLKLEAIWRHVLLEAPIVSHDIKRVRRAVGLSRSYNAGHVLKDPCRREREDEYFHPVREVRTLLCVLKHDAHIVTLRQELVEEHNQIVVALCAASFGAYARPQAPRFGAACASRTSRIMHTCSITASGVDLRCLNRWARGEDNSMLVNKWFPSRPHGIIAPY